MHEGYGLTETSPTVSFNYVGEPIRPGTVGRPLWGVDVEIAEAEVEDRIVLLPPGELGEIVVRGHNLFKGYLGDPDASAAAVVDGWFRTGDLGTKDADGIVTIVDRKKDMIVRNGYNVYPTRGRGRDDAAPRGRAGGRVRRRRRRPRPGGARRRGRCSTAHEVDADELVAFTKERIAAYKYPRVVHLVDALPLGGERQGAQARARRAVLDGARRGVASTTEARSRGGPRPPSCRAQAVRDAVVLERHRTRPCTARPAPSPASLTYVVPM